MTYERRRRRDCEQGLIIIISLAAESLWAASASNDKANRLELKFAFCFAIETKHVYRFQFLFEIS